MHEELTKDHMSDLVEIHGQVSVIEHRLQEMADQLEYGTDVESVVQTTRMTVNTLRIQIVNLLLD